MLQRGILQVTSAGLYPNDNTVPGSLVLDWVRLPSLDRMTYLTEVGKGGSKSTPRYNPASDMEDSVHLLGHNHKSSV